MHVKASTYYDNVNSGLLNAIPESAVTILEIGCGTGNLGAAVKARQPQCRYYGVEIHDVSAQIADTRLDHVWHGAVEQVDLGSLAGQIDCIVYGDVLEHLVDPWGLLKAHRRLLASGGRMVASIPNVQYWALLVQLLRGNWVYMDHGILDDTHLRFFTLNSVHAMFAAADMTVDNALGLIPDPDHSGALLAAMRPVLGVLQVDEERFRQEIAPQQFLIQASCAER